MTSVEFLTQQPAETTIYFIAGFSVILGTLLLYVFSLWFRWRQNYREFKDLQSVDETEEF